MCVYVQHRHKQGKAGKSTPLAQAGSAQKRELMAAATRTDLVRLLCSSKKLHVKQLVAQAQCMSCDGACRARQAVQVVAESCQEMPRDEERDNKW